MSLDGVIQGPGGPGEDTSNGFTLSGWTAPYFDDESGKIMNEQMKLPFSLLLGRKTFQIWENFWPQHEAEWPGVNSVTKYVVSKSLSKTDWKNTVFINENAVDALKKLKKEDGPNLHVYGSSGLAHTLLENDLVDEIWLKTYPVVLGKGKRLFDESSFPVAFKLVSSKTVPSGVIFANYQRVGEVKVGSVEA